MTDPYFKLRPNEATPSEECCHCTQLSAVYLAHKLADNPVYCATCRGEVAPERIGLDETTTELLARWNGVYGAVYRLWLDSSAYEKWAESELLNRDSEINRIGMKATEALARYVPTTYLWFWQGQQPTSCPSCDSSDFVKHGPLFLCEKCNVSV